MSARLVAVLEVGGTHVAATVVDTDAWSVLAEAHRVRLDSHADAEAILNAFIAAGAGLRAARGLAWSVAMPDPFDYRAGIGRFHGVGKFEALDGVDVRAALLRGLPQPSRVAFLNDADAFTLGEALHGVGQGRRQCVGLTLGTGVGTGWVSDGVAVDSGPGVPPRGRIHLVHVNGRPLEESMSRRAIRRAYARATGDSDADVRQIAERARSGEAAANTVLRDALYSLGAALGPRLRAFGADLLVVGGSMSASWELFEPWVREGMADAGATMPAVAISPDPERAALLGAAHAAL